MEDDSHITIITPASNINTDKEPINKKDNNNNNNSNNNNSNSNNNNSSNNNDNNKNNLSPTATTTTNSGSKDKNINTIDHSNLPQINKQNYTSTVINKDNLLTENNNNITNTNNHDNNASKSPDPSSILQQQQQQQKPAASKNAKGVVYNIKDVLQDPTHTLWHIEPERMADPGKSKKFKEILTSANVDLVSLRSICWSGIPMQFRLMAWQLLLGYLPCNSERREETLARKRKEYSDSVKASYSRGNSGLDQSLYHQIHIDILRTNPGVPLYQSTTTQGCLERILYQWAIRHPASGYVQGINDLVTPIFEVFLSAYIDSDPENYDVNSLNQEILDVIEADSFWCLSKLLDGIQDNYTFAQPGIQRQIVTLKDLVSRIDAQLANHLQQEGVEFIQFAFRWMNCLLMRELPLKNTIRMWDTYLAEGSSEGFSEFHVYVCAAFLVKWSTQLQKMDFQEIMIFLQQLPTSGWQEKDIELLLSEAYMWKTLFHNAPNHLKNK
ncbi:unnamed protein product [Cunninghamella echinulata]